MPAHPECSHCDHELCEVCRSADVTKHDDDGVPFCTKCWADVFEAAEA